MKVFRQEELTLAGDVLLTASYLSYVGCFGRSYRLDMLDNKWMPFFNSLNVSIHNLILGRYTVTVCHRKLHVR